MSFLSFLTLGKAHVFIIPVNLRIMEHKPVMSQNDFMSMYFSQYELYVFNMSSDEKSHVGGVLERSSSIHSSIHISEYHRSVHFLIIKLESSSPVEVHNRGGTSRVNQNVHCVSLHGIQGLNVGVVLQLPFSSMSIYLFGVPLPIIVVVVIGYIFSF